MLIGAQNFDGVFQPTLPARGATVRRRPAPCRRWNFNPRSPHGERHFWNREREEHASISTHAPRTGSDRLNTIEGALQADFNPRSPHGERRAFNRFFLYGNQISTHAPRTGSDHK